MSVPRGTAPSFGANVGRDDRGRFVHLAEVSVKLSCPICIGGDTTVGWKQGRIAHRIERRGLLGTYLYQSCTDWDTEGRHVSEPIGFYVFAWWPTLCRNGKRRWLVSVERHADGSYTLGNRAH